MSRPSTKSSNILVTVSSQTLSVLDPKVWINRSLDHVKKQVRLLGESCTNVINIAHLPELMSEVSNLKRLGGIEGEEDTEPDMFFAAIAGKKDANDDKEFPLLKKIGSSLCTIDNSSSPA